MTHFTEGFADELVKTARLGAAVKRVLSRKPGQMGFFQRRRLAKVLGVKPHQVEQALARRQRKAKRRRTLVAAGALGAGTALGSVLT